MALNFALLDPDAPAKIAGSVYAGQQARQENALAQQRLQAGTQQLETGRLQQQESQMKMDQMVRDREALAQLQKTFVANGKSPDLETNFNAMIQSGIPHFVDIGTSGLQKIQQQKQFAAIMGGGTQPAAAAQPFQPSAAPGALGSGTFDLTAPAKAAPVNALAPATAVAPAPTNALMAKPDVAAMRAKRDQLLAMGTTQSIAAARALDADIALASKEPVYHNVPGVGLVDPRTGRVVMPSVEKPAAPPSMVAEYTFAKTPEGGGYVGSFEKFVRDRAIAARPPGAPKEDKTPSGYRFTPSGELEAIPGGPAAKPKEPTVSEQNASYNINRVLRAATEIKDVTSKDPSALAPGAAEASAQSMGMGGAANVARSSNRQIVYGAQRDALDALLYLATGAAYNKEQLQGAWDSYMPAYTDDAPTRIAKQQRLNTLLDDAKTRAGKAWTPKMESAMSSLIAPAATPPAVVPGRTLAPAVVQSAGGFKYLGKESK